MIPKTKHDYAAVEALERAPDAEVLARLPELLEWLQDINWPVAPRIANRLRPLGLPLRDPIAQILRTSDYVWIGWVLRELVEPRTDLARALTPELRELIGRVRGAEDEDAERLWQDVLSAYLSS